MFYVSASIDRMPVILGDKESSDMWLTGASSKFHMVLKPYEGSDLVRFSTNIRMHCVIMLSTYLKMNLTFRCGTQ